MTASSMGLYLHDEDTEKLLGSPSGTPSPSRRGSGSQGPTRGFVSTLWRFLSTLLVRARRHAKLIVALLCILALSITYLIYHFRPLPPPPYPWRNECRSSFRTHWVLSDDPVPSDRRVSVLEPDNPAWPFHGQQQLPRPGDVGMYAPANVFIGVFTVAAAVERRQIIRQTYKRQGKEGVKWVFVLGRPSGWGAGALKAEAELYGDMVFLPMNENMNKGKTYAFFRWVAQHATMDDNGRRPDYVMKSDDDSFIMLDELEKRLRLTPRSMTYWGLLMFGLYRQQAHQGEYMSGGGYAMSFDLVQYISASPYAAGHIKGHEDQVVGDWIRAHPRAQDIIWVVERCWIYDHPRQTGWAMAHGFLFPNVVSHIRSTTEHLAGHVPPLPSSFYSSWSTVTDWLVPYSPPPSLAPLSASERIEAMIEGSAMSLLHPHNRRYANATTTSNVKPALPEEVTAPLRQGEGERLSRQQVQQAWERRQSMEERMTGYEETGSTVYVHEVKQDAWWIEVGLALLGPNAWAGTDFGM